MDTPQDTKPSRRQRLAAAATAKRFTVLLDVTGLAAVPAGAGLLWGTGAGLLAFAAAALALSWRLSS